MTINGLLKNCAYSPLGKAYLRTMGENPKHTLGNKDKTNGFSIAQDIEVDLKFQGIPFRISIIRSLNNLD